MSTITIPQELIREKELIAIPRKKYEEFLNLQKIIKNRLAEIADTELALKIYKEEKKLGKLRIIKSLSELD